MSAATLEAPEPGALFSPDLLQRLDLNGPRYTSYPTADRFGAGFGPADYLQALQARAAHAPAGGRPPLSVYVHIPFCESVCYYCACNKVVTRHHERAADYLTALEREMRLHQQVLGAQDHASQLHLGGGTPTFLSDEELQRLMAALRAAFHFVPGAEMSIEVDPRTATPARLAHLAALGFNRLSFGVQDVDPAVQQAVHRVQPFEQVQELMASARALGFESVNVDLIYGLPRQTPASFLNTIAQVGRLRPDRIALYAYAHLPQRFKPQRRIVPAELPDGGARVAMLRAGIEGFLGQGYDYIGMDHFALPGDALAVARRQGRLHRNFQGYSTQPDCDLVALGVSAIGRIGATYSQNAKTLDEYYESLRQGRFATVRGLALSADDLLRRDLIMALMCQGRADFDALERAHGVDMPRYFAAELQRLQPLEELGLARCEPRAVQVTAAGWYFVRAVAMVFDRYLQKQDAEGRFSRIV